MYNCMPIKFCYSFIFFYTKNNKWFQAPPKHLFTVADRHISDLRQSDDAIYP